MPDEEVKEKGESVKQEEAPKVEGTETVETDPAAALEEAATEEVSEEVEEEPSPFQKMMGNIPKEDRAALLARYVEDLSDEEKAQLPWVKEEARKSEELSQRKVSEEERRRQATTYQAAGEQSASALRRMETHLEEVRQGLLKGEQSVFDVDTIDAALEDYATAQSQLRNQGFISTISTILVSLIESEGEPMTKEYIEEMIAGKGGTFQDLFKAYTGEYGTRRYNAGLEAGRGEAQSLDATWRKAELAAMRAELQGKDGPTGEPDATTGVAESLSDAPLDSSASPIDKIATGIGQHRKGSKKKGKV